jgi:hydrogenase/urease accessory protein HupE
MGGSRWSFSKHAISSFVDLKTPVFSEIKPIKEGHYDLASASDEQLQKIATGVIQPYINKKISITVNDKTYPIKVNKIIRGGGNDIYTIWISVDHVDFNKPVNEVKIVYSLLFEETDNQHVNLAFGYLSDATGDALQQVFDLSHPVFQTTFDANDTVWHVSVEGVAPMPTVAEKNANSIAKNGLEGIQNPLEKKATASNPPVSVVTAEDALYKRTSDDVLSASPSASLRAASADGKGNPSVSPNSVKRSMWTALWTTLRQFVPLGVEHILTGYDHIAFLLAIIVIELSIGQILKIITAFTVAHSITLLLSALQIVRVNPAMVESVIALSICYVALENIFKKKADYRWLITFGFGLIHGFGFASALRELIMGKSNLLLSVLSFNIGVEMGQLMLLCALLPILYLLKKQIGYRIVTVSTSAGVFVMGFAWLIERVFNQKLLWF